MNPSTKLIWLFLAQQAGDRGEIQVSIETMGTRLHLSHHTIVKGVRHLVDGGMVERVRLGKAQTATRYRIVEEPTFLVNAA